MKGPLGLYRRKRSFTGQRKFTLTHWLHQLNIANASTQDHGKTEGQKRPLNRAKAYKVHRCIIGKPGKLLMSHLASSLSYTITLKSSVSLLKWQPRCPSLHTCSKPYQESQQTHLKTLGLTPQIYRTALKTFTVLLFGRDSPSIPFFSAIRMFSRRLTFLRILYPSPHPSLSIPRILLDIESPNWYYCEYDELFEQALLA
jgi:hypothetical protein